MSKCPSPLPGFLSPHQVGSEGGGPPRPGVVTLLGKRLDMIRKQYSRPPHCLLSSQGNLKKINKSMIASASKDGETRQDFACIQPPTPVHRRNGDRRNPQGSPFAKLWNKERASIHMPLLLPGLPRATRRPRPPRSARLRSLATCPGAAARPPPPPPSRLGTRRGRAPGRGLRSPRAALLHTCSRAPRPTLRPERAAGLHPGARGSGLHPGALSSGGRRQVGRCAEPPARP